MSWNFCVPTVALFQSVSCNFHSCSWSVAESTLLVAICLLPSHDHLLWVGMSEPFLFLLQLQEILTKNGLKLDSVIEFAIEDDLLVKRITGRYALWLTSNLGQLLWRLKEPGYDRGVGHSVHCWQNRTALLHLVTAFGKVVIHMNLWTATSSCQSALSLACVLELGYNLSSIECLSCLAFVWSWRL